MADEHSEAKCERCERLNKALEIAKEMLENQLKQNALLNELLLTRRITDANDTYGSDVSWSDF